jgi:hypothetical protein
MLEDHASSGVRQSLVRGRAISCHGAHQSKDLSVRADLAGAVGKRRSWQALLERVLARRHWIAFLASGFGNLAVSAVGLNDASIVCAELVLSDAIGVTDALHAVAAPGALGKKDIAVRGG